MDLRLGFLKVIYSGWISMTTPASFVLEEEFRGASRAAATSKMERFAIIVITKHSILDVAAALDPPLDIADKFEHIHPDLLSNLSELR